jgi:hypothetical protein
MSKLEACLRERALLQNGGVLSGLHYLPARAMASLRRALRDLDARWSPHAISPMHLPLLVAPEILQDVDFRPEVRLTWAMDGRQRKRRGALPLQGGALEALPFVGLETRSYRQLPRGFYSVESAYAPLADGQGVSGWENIHCVNGVDVRAAGAPPRMQGLIVGFLESAGIGFTARRRPWWFVAEAVVLETEAGEPLAVVQACPAAVAERFGLRYVDADNGSQLAEIELFYVSQDALLWAGVTAT